MMQIIGCDLTREGGRMIGTTVLAFLAGLITSLADGDAFSLSLGTGLLILTVILLAVRILRLYQKSLFTEEAHFLMTLPMPAKDLLRGRLAVGIMWMSMAEIAYCSPILLSLLYNEADAFEQDKMQVIIYWMMERESSTVDITVLAALLVPLILIADGLLCSLTLYLCFLKNNGNKKGVLLMIVGTAATAGLLGLAFVTLLEKGSFPFGMLYAVAAGGAVMTVLLFRRCRALLETGHDVA
ncbi:hypothetical protein AAK943_15060 [Emergencia timonensis]|nr:hypothetical protein [Emergencia timonensis]WNX87325.1 hypothetical protein RVY71_13990 [Emergencia timonensis]